MRIGLGSAFRQRRVKRSRFLRRTPAFVDRWLNSTGLLRWAARHSHMTSAREHGAMALEMLNVETSPFLRR